MYDTIEGELIAAGYEAHTMILKTKSFGIPQARERMNLVATNKKATRGKKFEFPEPHRKLIPLKTLLGGDEDTPIRRVTSKSLQAMLPPATEKRARKIVVGAVKKFVKEHSAQDLKELVLVIDTGSSPKFARCMVNIFPTITASRGSDLGYWIIMNGKGRRVTPLDLLRLQGIPPKTVNYVKAGLSPGRIGHMCGNTMSKNILDALLPKVLGAIGIKPTG